MAEKTRSASGIEDVTALDLRAVSGCACFKICQNRREQIEIVKSATQKRTTGVSQTVTSTMALNSAVGVSVDAICMARTITAGTAGAIGDMGKIHVEGLVTNPAGTSSLVGTTATIATQGAAASNPVASCVISGNASGQVIVTATGASNGAGLVLDWGIFVTLEQL